LPSDKVADLDPNLLGKKTTPPASGTFNSSPAPLSKQHDSEPRGESLLDLFSSNLVTTGFENETHKTLLELLREIDDSNLINRLILAIAAAFPVRDALRHGTPEQKLFALNAMGDKFLAGVSGLQFPQRKPLIKTMGKYFSEITEFFSFLQSEGEPFNNQYHERVEGSNFSGRIVREMRGFLVVRKNSDQIIRLGLVLT